MDNEPITIVVDKDDKKRDSGDDYHFLRDWFLHYVPPALIGLIIALHAINQRYPSPHAEAKREFMEMQQRADRGEASEIELRLLGIEPDKSNKPNTKPQPQAQ